MTYSKKNEIGENLTEKPKKKKGLQKIFDIKFKNENQFFIISKGCKIRLFDIAKQ